MIVTDAYTEWQTLMLIGALGSDGSSGCCFSGSVMAMYHKTIDVTADGAKVDLASTSVFSNGQI
jgi:hypothetical protein